MKHSIQKIVTYGLYPFLLITVAFIVFYSIHQHCNYKYVYAVTTAFLVLTLMIMEYLFPLSHEWKMNGSGFRRDLSYMAINAPVIILTKAAFGVGAIYYHEHHTGIFSTTTLVLSVPAFLLIFEFFQYWYHRISHTAKGRTGFFLWKIHVAHHLPDKVYVFMHGVFNPVNVFITSIIIQTPLLLLGISPEAALISTLLIDLQSLISHFNVDIRTGFLNYIFIGTETHRYHHSANREDAGNYGNTLSAWDIIFGTFKYTPGMIPATLGTDNPDAYPDSKNLWQLVLLPFKKKPGISKTIICLFFVISVSCLTSFKTEGQTRGGIKGKVLEQTTGQPVYGAVVRLQDTLASGAVTDTAGLFVISGIPEGNYSIIVSYMGFQEKIIHDIIVVRDKIFYVEIELLESAFISKEVVISSPAYDNNPLMPVSSYSFSREEIFRNPGAQGDIFRAIGMLPGVSSSGGQFSAIAVRGQGTRDNVYMVDDIPMFEVSHLEGDFGGFNDPNGGRFSIFAPRVIDHAQFQGGGFAAQYGRKSSSYLGLKIKEGNMETSSLSAQLDLLGGTLIYDGPSRLYKHTSIFATARYQNFTLLQKMVGLQSLGLPVYSDFLVKTTTRINTSNKLSFIAMYNPEHFTRTAQNVQQGDRIENTDIGDFKVNKSMVGLNLQTLTSINSSWKNVVYYRTLDRNVSQGTSYPVSDADGNILNKTTIPYETNIRIIGNQQNEIGYRSVFTKQYKKLLVTTGVDLAHVLIDYSRQLNRNDTLYIIGTTDNRQAPSQYYTILQPAYVNAAFKKSADNASAYGDVSFTVLQRLTFNSGLRYDYTGSTKQHTLSPRVSGSIKLDAKSSINFAAGIFYQDPLYTDVADQAAGHILKNERIVQYILGYKNYLNTHVKFTAEGWYKSFDNLIVRPFRGQPLLNNNGTGYAYGFDINLSKRLSEKYYGQLGYSYMQSKRNNNDGQGEYNFAFSQPHMLNALFSYKPNNKWIFSTKFRYATGRPKDTYVIHADVFNNPGFIRYSQEITHTNGSRLNDFISWDIRVDYRMEFNTFSGTFFIDIVNVLNHPNQSAEIFQPITGKTYYDGLGIFPTFGLRIEW